MHTKIPEEQYKIEYTDLFGKVYYSPVTTYTREFARQTVRMIRTDRTRPMFDTGKRACLSNIRVVKS